MVIVPPNTWHSFRPDGDNSLRHVAVYDSGEVDIELSSRPGERFNI
jgi:quercetin dioxygenase-like cupin family protein